jgi:cytochrome c556
MRVRSRILPASAALSLVAALNLGSATAQDKPEVIRERQALMKRQAEDLKSIQGYVSGEIDRTTALAKVNELLTLPGKIADLFPPGTSIAEFPGETHAKPEIWQQPDRFNEVPRALQRAEEKLAATLKNGSKQDVVDALDTVGRSGCGACHTYFRAPLQ